MISRALAGRMEADLVQVEDYWQKLKRGGNSIPFSDDIKLTSLSGVEQNILLIEVFYDPVRFRVDIAGSWIEQQYGGRLAGKFLDELRLRTLLEGLAQQCTAALETRGPSYCPNVSSSDQTKPGYARLVLPCWGDGHINTLLAAIVPVQQAARGAIKA